jgi:choline dehydrogenase-like flavoprotein
MPGSDDCVQVEMTPEGTARQFDVAVIGGGAAGLSAAVALGWARRAVIVLDDGSPRNAPAYGVHNYLTRDGMPPAELLAAGRREAERYGSLIISGEATTARRRGDGFEVITAEAEVVLARRLLVSTGLADELPGVPGVRELWGSHVVHCPYRPGHPRRHRPGGTPGHRRRKAGWRAHARRPGHRPHGDGGGAQDGGALADTEQPRAPSRPPSARYGGGGARRVRPERPDGAEETRRAVERARRRDSAGA